MATIEIDFDVFKELTTRRLTESMTYNDVIRSLLRLPPHPPASEKRNNAQALRGWTNKGVFFPEGTEFRATYKGALYTARIVNGEFIQEGTPRNSPSEAAHAVTNNSVNGWTFWECRRPGDTSWRLIKGLRQER